MLISMFSGMDLSWLENASMHVDVSVLEDLMAEKMNLSVNDTGIASASFQMDMKTMDFLMQIPELSSALLKGNYMTMLDSVDDEQMSSEDIKAMMSMSTAMISMMKNPPSAEVMSNILRKYLNMFFDAWTDDGADTATVEVDGLSAEYNTYSGYIDAVDFEPLAQQILTEARDDADIKAIYDSMDESGDAYAEFQSGIDSALATFEGEVKDEAADAEAEADAEADADEGYIYQTVYTNADNEIVGTDTFLMEDEETVAFEFYLAGIDEGDQRALDIYASSGEDFFEIVGTGEIADGLLNGEYEVCLSMSEDPVARILVEGYDPAVTRDGGLKGTYSIIPVVPEGEDESGLGFLAAFSLAFVADMTNEGGLMELDLNYSDSTIATILLSGGYGDGVEAIDEASAEKVYDITDEQAMGEFAMNMDMTTILSNLMDSGMPESFLAMIMGGGQEAGATAEISGEAAAGDAQAAA